MDQKSALVQRCAPKFSARAATIMQLSPEVRDVYEGLKESHDELTATRYLMVMAAPPAAQRDQTKAKQTKQQTFLRRKREITRALGDDCLNMREIAKRIDMAPETTRRWLEEMEKTGVVISSKPDNYVRYYRLKK